MLACKSRQDFVAGFAQWAQLRSLQYMKQSATYRVMSTKYRCFHMIQYGVPFVSYALKIRSPCPFKADASMQLLKPELKTSQQLHTWPKIVVPP